MVCLVGGEMQQPRTNGDIDCDFDLAKALDALSSPVRLAIVRALEEPRSLCEIGISPSDYPARGSGVRGSILSRQTVKMHIDRLAEVGIVQASKVPRHKGQGTEYSLNPDSLVAISDAFQRLARGLAPQRQDLSSMGVAPSSGQNAQAAASAAYP
jgi:DNA-binding transcriptional ArsR family regulator